MAAVQESYVRFSEFLELIPDATVAVGRDGEIVLANRAAQEVFGYPRDQLEGLSVDALVPERFRAGHAGHRDHYVSDPQTRPMGAGLELYGLRADGSEFPAEISLSSTTTAEGVLAIAAIRDITDRVGADAERARLEAELKLTQSQRLESIGQLAGGIAHDFNNLLAVIINYAEFASAAADSPEVLDDVAEIQSAAKRAAALTRQLLIFSRREGVKLEPMQLNESLENLEKLLRRVLGEHIQLSTKFAADLWPVVADAGQIEQIAMNLAVNARDAMPDGGVLKSNGYKVVDFSRGLDAVEFLKADPGEVALLLSDVIMPEMQGSELAREAGRLRPDLPVLFMSGYSELMFERVDPTQAGVNLIEKPFSVNDLLREVRRVLKTGAG